MKEILLAAAVLIAVSAYEDAYGHGVGSETFPPVDLGGRQVTLEVSSSQSDPDTDDDQQISVSLIDFDSKVTLRDVTFLISAERGNKFLFEREFDADNGFVVFNFVSEDTDGIVIEEADNSFFGSLLGLDSRLVHVRGPDLSAGGLYKLDVTVLAADGYSNILEEPLVFNAGISIAQTTTHAIEDPDFGIQNVGVITYYDEISDFQYDPDLAEISYSMPFEWTLDNINQTSVVHEEISIPKSFGTLLASGFVMNVNGVDLSEDVVNIDDFFDQNRIVHFTIYQRELLNILENGTNDSHMHFKIRPSSDYPHLSSVTENGQFRILVSWEPEYLQSGSDARISFDVTDVFLKDKPVPATYDLVITHGQDTIYDQTGTSTGSKDMHDYAEFTIPDGVSGIIYLNFENLDGNDLARTSIPIVVHGAGSTAAIPDWIRDAALWWSEGQIDDDTFVRGIQYLVQNGIIAVSHVEQDGRSDAIPGWVRDSAAWWADGTIDDQTFVGSLEYLIKNGVIRI